MSEKTDNAAGFLTLPANLPRPVDDGACDHLAHTLLPHIPLASTAGRQVDLAAQSGIVVAYFYPMTGTPGKALPLGWDAIPGARGCTPQACAFRDHAAELSALGATIFGISVQSTDEQREAAERLHLPFELLSDERRELAGALNLPLFTADGRQLIRRLTLIIEDGRIEQVFYPVFPPDAHAAEVVRWLGNHQKR